MHNNKTAPSAFYPGWMLSCFGLAADCSRPKAPHSAAAPAETSGPFQICLIGPGFSASLTAA